MVVTTIFLLAPFALFASIIYSFLYLDKSKIENLIKNKIINRLLFIITYIIIIILFTVFLSILGMSLLVGIIGLPVLIIIDIIGIILFFRKILIRKKNKDIKEYL
ncbi:MAG: hypothetical protein LBU85_01810 [Treponema sp.]|jgi:hypothetical protein|nr:hypothetical protein [Treponema sp.]